MQQLQQNPQRNFIQQNDIQKTINNEEEKIQVNQTIKKGFKIKKNKHWTNKKNAYFDIFNNPIYAGLQNDINVQKDQHNFGPWIHQDDNKMRQSKYKKADKIGHNQNIANSAAYQQNLTLQRWTSSGNLSVQAPIRSVMLQENQINLASMLPQIRQKRQGHQIHISALTFTPQNLPSLNPSLSMPKIKYNNKQKSMYSSPILKSVISKELKQYIKLKDQIVYHSVRDQARPTQVIYNYCYQNYQHNLFCKDRYKREYNKDKELNICTRSINNNQQINKNIQILNKKQIAKQILQQLKNRKNRNR